MIVDHWIWAEFADGSPLMPGIDLTGDEDRTAIVADLFADYEDIVCIREWEQHEQYPGIAESPVNVCIETWERPS